MFGAKRKLIKLFSREDEEERQLRELIREAIEEARIREIIRNGGLPPHPHP